MFTVQVANLNGARLRRSPLKSVRSGVGLDAIGFSPRIQVSSLIHNLSAELVKGRAHPSVAPLCKFLAVTDHFEFGIAGNAGFVVVK
jgi:hypothetical protein